MIVKAYWYVATSKNKKEYKENVIWRISDQIVIFGHLGLKHVFRYIWVKNDHLTVDDGLLEAYWYIATRTPKNKFK